MVLIVWVLGTELWVGLRGLEESVLRQRELHSTMLTDPSPCAQGAEREGGMEGSTTWVSGGSAWIWVTAVPATASPGAWELWC